MISFPLPQWIRRYQAYGVILLLSALLMSITGLALQAQIQPEAARKAADFVNSVGIVTHLGYVDTAYRNYDSVIKPRLQELGVRHIRDAGSGKPFLNKLNDLATLGIKSTLMMEPQHGKNIYPSNVVADVIKPALASIEAVEGPNEWDIQPEATYKGQPFPQGLRRYQKELYAAVKRNPATSSIPVILPSVAFPTNGLKLGYLAAGDIGNMHSYAGGNLPSHDLKVKWIPSAQVVSGLDKPIIATECGWHNAIQDPKALHPGVSESAAAKYVPRLYLEYFNHNIQRAFLYELINERSSGGQEQNFGLLFYDGSPKPAFTSLRNLLFLLRDDAQANFPLKSLNYSLSGYTAQVHHTLLQKSDGRMYLVLWQEVPGFNLVTKTDQSVPDRPITLTLNTAIDQATLYLPVSSITPIRQYRNPKQLQINVPDHPLVIELLPHSL